MNRNTILVAAALLVPGAAHAEFQTKQSTRSYMPARSATTEPLTVGVVLAKINNLYLTGFRRCYIKALSADPNVEGKVVVTFTVHATGRVSGVVKGVSPRVDACLISQLVKWRFPSPRNDRGGATSETFRLGLVLRQ